MRPITDWTGRFRISPCDTTYWRIDYNLDASWWPFKDWSPIYNDRGDRWRFPSIPAAQYHIDHVFIPEYNYQVLSDRNRRVHSMKKPVFYR